MFRFSISSSVYAVIATGMSLIDSSLALAVTTISSMSLETDSWAIAGLKLNTIAKTIVNNEFLIINTSP